MFAVSQLGPSELQSAPVGVPDDTGVLGAAWATVQNNYFNQRLGGREEALSTAFLQRDQDVQRRTGQTVSSPGEVAGAQGAFGDGGGGVGPDLYQVLATSPEASTAYEDKINALRAKFPQAMQGVPTDVELRTQVAQRLNDLEAKAQLGSAQHPLASFAGGAGAGFLDPLNMAAGVAPMGEGPLALRMLAQSGLWGGLAAAEALPKAAEAQTVGGPAYGLPEAESDVLGGLVSGPIFEGLHAAGAAVLGPALRRFLPAAEARLAEPDAAPERGALNVLSQAARDNQAVGALRSGGDYDAGLSSLARQAPPPAIEPSRDFEGDLFGLTPRDQPLEGAPAAPGASIFEGQEYRGRQIYAATFDPKELTTDPATFQYKSGGDAQGVTERLRDVQAWDPTSSGKVIVYDPGQGEPLTIADGHQRLALATRMDARGFEPRLDGYLFRQADGWTPQDVRTIAALKNIREGQGEPLDAAKVLREAPGALNDDSLPVSGEFMRQARGLANLSPEAFGAMVNKVIPERYGALIGKLAGERPDLHAGLVKLIKTADPQNLDEAHALINEALEDDWVKTQGAQGELFGDEAAQSVAIGRAKVKAWLVKQLRGDQRLFGGLVKNADAIEAGGNVLARDANEAGLAVNGAALEMIGKLGLRHGEIGEMLNQAAREVTEGGSLAKAGKAVLARVKGAIGNGEKLDLARSALLKPDTADHLGAAAASKDFGEVGGAGQKAQAIDKPEDAAGTKSARDLTPEKSGAQRQPKKGGLWRLAPEELQQLLEDKSTSDHDKLVQAFGEEGAREFDRLDRKQNSSNPDRADEGAREFEARFGDL